MDVTALLSIALALVAYGLVSRKLEGSSVTGPMLFSLFGLAAGPAALDLVPLTISNEALHLLAEITLMLVLFSDASGIDLAQLERDHNLPVRLLAIGMPLTLLLGAAAAWLLFDSLSLVEAALLAAVLMPTDAALGQAVIKHPAVPVRIRQTLNVESGLNDGIALPVVLILAAFASATGAQSGAGGWLAFAAAQIALGPLAGAALGYAGARLVTACRARGFMPDAAEGMVGLGLAFGAFALAETIHGNGFIGAFVAGLAFGNTLKRQCRFLYEFTESEGQILTLLTFAAFGAAMLPEAAQTITPLTLAYALLSLTLVRMLPARLALLGTGVRPVTPVFLGWFGPRGLASILFVLLIVEETDTANESLLFAVSVATVAASIVLHGVTAAPAARWYGVRVGRLGEGEEHKPVSDAPFSRADR